MVDSNFDSDSVDSDGNLKPKPDFKVIPLARLDIECQLAGDKSKYLLKSKQN